MALRTIPKSLVSHVTVVALSINLLLLAFLGVAAVVGPAVLGLFGLETARAGRWMRGGVRGLPREHNRVGMIALSEGMR